MVGKKDIRGQRSEVGERKARGRRSEAGKRKTRGRNSESRPLTSDFGLRTSEPYLNRSTEDLLP
jgi:hypothetical protein